MQKIRFYVYGVNSKCCNDDNHEDFLSTHLSEEAAVDWVNKHRTVFPERYEYYSLRHVDTEVKKV